MWRGDAVFDHFEAALNVTLCIGNGLAVLARQSLGELVHVPVEQVNELHHNARAALRVNRAPSGLGCSSNLDGCVDFGLGGKWNLRLNLAGGRVKNIGHAPGRSGDMRAVHVVAELLHKYDSSSRFHSGIAVCDRHEKGACACVSSVDTDKLCLAR